MEPDSNKARPAPPPPPAVPETEDEKWGRIQADLDDFGEPQDGEDARALDELNQAIEADRSAGDV